MRTPVPLGRSIGTPGGGLDNATWARNAATARIGREGERRTAALLDVACRRTGGATVLHDLIIPGSRANIDHLVVAGRTVWVVDTKVWAPGVYWRVGGRAFRGMARFEPAEKRTTTLAVDRLGGYLRGLGLDAVFAAPTVVVWPSGASAPLLLLGRAGDSPVVSGRTFGWAVRSMTRPRRFGAGRVRTADQALVEGLSSLLVSRRGRRADSVAVASDRGPRRA
ncbi:nuclease-related domain-containing protein [Microlunatus ginsengisoli]|uniref:nuclease-related domain-containing protein n=1 Tax=Microlunatus ginsengisoli TaxID=363863 RepID=UPI0031CF9605